MENFWMNKVKSSKQFDMVFIGDSRCYRGIQPAVFEKELGLTAFNAGLSSGGHNMEIYNHISNNILSEPKGGGGTRIIVLSVSPYSMSEEARSNKHFKSLLKTSKLADSKIGSILFQKNIKKRLKRAKKKFIAKEIFHKNGWCQTFEYASEPLQTDGLNIYNATYKNTTFSPQSLRDIIEYPQSLRDIIEYTKQCIKDNIIIFAFTPPTTPAMKALENEKSGCDMHAVKSAFQKAGGIWLDIENENVYNAYDSSHLSSEQAIMLSQYLSRKIKHTLQFLETGTLNHQTNN